MTTGYIRFNMRPEKNKARSAILGRALRTARQTLFSHDGARIKSSLQFIHLIIFQIL